MRHFAPYHAAFTFMVTTLLLGACSSTTGPSDPGGPPPGGPPPSGPYAALQGIWQETRASSGDFRNPSTGYEFSATEGFSTQLIIGADGAYRQAYYSSGYHSACTAPITYFEQSVGTVAVSGNHLTLQPSQHRVTVTGCNGSVVDLGKTPIAYTFEVVQQFYDASGRIYYMNLDGGPHPLELELLHHAPASSPLTQPQPVDFELGSEPMYLQFMGTWSASKGSRLDFYDPDTNEYYIPDLDGNHHQWISFSDEPERNYEFATVWRDPYGQGVCKKNSIYWERGKTTFYLLEADAEGAFAHVRFEPTDARLIVVISNCDDLSQTIGYELPLVTSYYRFRYTAAADPQNDSVSLNCNWERTEWQFMMCEDEDWASFTRR